MSGSDRVNRWYFGGIAGSLAVTFTHPLDLLKVHLQTQKDTKVSMPRLAMNILKTDGIAGYYSGLTASIMRQMTYTIARFGVYETAKMHMPPGSNNSFAQKIGLAAFAGACGGLVGSPADMINVRMQNDVKLPFEQRRHYKNAIDGVYRVAKEEGVRKLFNGGYTCLTHSLLNCICLGSMAIVRAMLMTVG
jgi:dicarboxylate transporter 10